MTVRTCAGFMDSETEFPKLWSISVSNDPPHIDPDGTLVFMRDGVNTQRHTHLGFFVCDLSETDGEFPLRQLHRSRHITCAGFYVK